jgi:hypothetical protein
LAAAWFRGGKQHAGKYLFPAKHNPVMKKHVCIILLFLLVRVTTMAQSACDPGDQKGKPGCPDPSGICPPSATVDSFGIPIFDPADPNEIIGPAGYDTSRRWVSVNAQLNYKILFENDPEFATAPALKVIIYLPIDGKLNPNSFRLGDFGFGSFLFNVPPNTAAYTARLNVKDSLGVYVDVTAGLDMVNRRAFWVFESIDTLTGLSSTLPTNAGFLPVNDSLLGNGTGFVSFTILPVAQAHTTDTVYATAGIIFDSNENINTNTWLNTIDSKPPQSRMDTLAPVVEPAFMLNWQGLDDSLGCGIKNYELYVSKNGAPFSFLEIADSTRYLFVGEPGVTYGFITRAIDFTGNKESLKSIADQTVTVRLPNTTICPGANTVFGVPDNGPAYTYQWQTDTTGIGASFTNLTENTVFHGTNSDSLILVAPPTNYYGRLFRCAISNGGTTVITAPQTLKFSTTWKGTVNTAWENAANWSCNTVPDGFTDVIIPSVNGSLPIVNSNAACRSLTLKPGTSLMVVSGYNLQVRGK